MRPIGWAMVGPLTASAHAQPKLVSVELKNGCTLEMPVRFDTASVAFSRQESSPASCPAAVLFTGMVSIGMVIRVNFTDSARDYFSIRTGKVKGGRFEYSLIQNLAPYQGLKWEDTAGKTHTVELPRLQSTDGVSGAKLQLTSVAAANGAPSFNKSALDFFGQRVAEWNRGPEFLIKRYSADTES